MAESQPENQMEGDQSTIGKIINKWVRDKREECLDKVNRNEEDFRRKVQNALTELYEAYDIDQLLIGEHDTVKYEDPFFQFAYMYKYVMFSARSLSKVMHDSNVLENLAMQTNITVACLGGGPGTDVLGVLDYFMKYMGDFKGQLDIQLYDRKDKWGTCWDSLEAAIAAQLQDPRVTVNFHDFHVIKDGLQNADVITMHYYMEKEYYRNLEVMQFFDNIIQTAKPGALFLYSGMYIYQVIHWVHQLILKNNCKLLTPDTKQPEPDTEQPGQPQRKYWYRDTSNGPKIEKWIPYAEVDLHQEGDLKLFYDIREDLKTVGSPTKDVSQRFDGKVVYRLYKKK